MSEDFRIIGNQDRFARWCFDAFCTDARADDGAAGGHSFEDLQAGAAASEERDGNGGGALQIGQNVIDAAGDLNGGTAEGTHGRWGIDAGEGESGVGDLPLDERKDAAG